MVNNYDWFGSVSFIDFLRDVGKYFTVNYMMSKESVKKRIETGISYTEFAYQIMQGYDFYELNDKYGVTLQIGGSDQWGNMTAGTELLRRKADKSGHVITVPLITDSTGKNSVNLKVTLSGLMLLKQHLTKCTNSGSTLWMMMLFAS